MTDRRFTIDEAQALVPWLQETFDAIEPLKVELAKAKARVQALMTRMQSNGGVRAEEDLRWALARVSSGKTSGASVKAKLALVLLDGIKVDKDIRKIIESM